MFTEIGGSVLELFSVDHRNDNLLYHSFLISLYEYRSQLPIRFFNIKKGAKCALFFVEEARAERAKAYFVEATDLFEL